MKSYAFKGLKREMRNKILIISSKRESELENIFLELVKKGGEIFFADSRQVAFQILEKEHPNIVFIDAPFFDEASDAWGHHKGAFFVLREKNENASENESTLHRPFKASLVFQKCQHFLLVPLEEEASASPM